MRWRRRATTWTWIFFYCLVCPGKTVGKKYINEKRTHTNDWEKKEKKTPVKKKKKDEGRNQ
jgi:hypothetical protein